MKVTKSQVKLFANGVKAVLTPANKKNVNSSSVLRIFDKDGCLIVHRETRNLLKFNGTMDKLTLRKDKSFSACGESITRELIVKRSKRAKADYTKWTQSSKDGYAGTVQHGRKGTPVPDNDPLLCEGMPLLSRTPVGMSKDKEVLTLLDKMCQQWFKFEKLDYVELATPKPMKFRSYYS